MAKSKRERRLRWRRLTVPLAAAAAKIVIAKAGVPRARLVAVKGLARRKPGGSKGRIQIASDFDAPLPPDVLSQFTGKKR